MPVYTVVPYKGELLCIEVSDATSFLRPGKVVQTMQVNGHATLPPVVKPRKSRSTRVFETDTLNRFQSASNGSLSHAEVASRFYQWTQREKLTGQHPAYRLITKFWEETKEKAKRNGNSTFGIIHYGWKKGWWEIVEEPKRQCAIELKGEA